MFPIKQHQIKPAPGLIVAPITAPFEISFHVVPNFGQREPSDLVPSQYYRRCRPLLNLFVRHFSSSRFLCLYSRCFRARYASRASLLSFSRYFSPFTISQPSSTGAIRLPSNSLL